MTYLTKSKTPDKLNAAQKQTSNSNKNVKCHTNNETINAGYETSNSAYITEGDITSQYIDFSSADISQSKIAFGFFYYVQI